MGALCSCFHVADEQDNTGSNNSSSHGCSCPKCFFQRLKNKHWNLFSRGQMLAITSTDQQQASSSNAGLVFNNISAASRPHDGAQGSMSRQRVEARERQEKGTRRLRIQPEPVGQTDVQVMPKTQENKVLISKEQNSESSAKVLTSGVVEITYMFPAPDDEDVCPTCLEEYTEENPKIIAKCSHHYHLSCIYEWMERSEKCPTCGKLMLFDETS